ncbi:M23 family metallopeptidase [Staphylococcus gallinarum]|nr:M23 family metallopeptidase [Staphylococcus gallinarum]MCD8857995.1 M23 family metallopeptidase [Staphylococcus gallinarum]
MTKLYTNQSHEPEESNNDFEALFNRSRETETFGEYQYSDFDGKHYGIDYDLPEDTPVKAVTDGVVTRTFNNKLGGKVIQIQEDNGRYHQWYMHLNTFKVAKGERVNAGDTIALSGNTGEQTTGSHLHFQRMKDGVGNQFAIDPKSFIDKLPNGEKSLYEL